VFENRVLSRIFRSQRKVVAGGGRRLHNEELHDLYASPNVIRVIISRRIRRAVLVGRMEKMTNAYNILVSKPEGKSKLKT
jgi:hypothetical protein